MRLLAIWSKRRGNQIGPHAGWTPSNVVILGHLGHDAEGNLVERPSTIKPDGFRYAGTPSFWPAIG
jgi:hypothetical protein